MYENIRSSTFAKRDSMMWCLPPTRC